MTPNIAVEAAGLVVMLDAAGRTIAELEQQVDRLTRAVDAERQQRIELTALLAQIRAECDTSSLTPQGDGNAHSEGHDRPHQARNGEG